MSDGHESSEDDFAAALLAPSVRVQPRFSYPRDEHAVSHLCLTMRHANLKTNATKREYGTVDAAAQGMVKMGGQPVAVALAKLGPRPENEALARKHSLKTVAAIARFAKPGRCTTSDDIVLGFEPTLRTCDAARLHRVMPKTVRHQRMVTAFATLNLAIEAVYG